MESPAHFSRMCHTGFGRLHSCPHILIRQLGKLGSLRQSQRKRAASSLSTLAMRMFGMPATPKLKYASELQRTITMPIFLFFLPNG